MRFTVNQRVVIWFSQEVEADSPQSAEAEARDNYLGWKRTKQTEPMLTHTVEPCV